jgi:AP2 domain
MAVSRRAVDEDLRRLGTLLSKYSMRGASLSGGKHGEGMREPERDAPRGKTRSHNTSGYLGVSRGPTPGTWAAYISRNKTRHYLGLFETPEAAAAAYREAQKRLDEDAPDPRLLLLNTARRLYDQFGPSALTTKSLNESGVSEGKLRRFGLSHAGLLTELGITEEYQRWRGETATYAGRTTPRWNWERAVEVARELTELHGDLPTVQWCRLNGHSQLTNIVHRLGRDWEDLRLAIGQRATVMRDGKKRYYDSRSGIRWRSRPEACVSNFLYARGIEHRRGDRYPAEYDAKYGRLYGRYDIHFASRAGQEIDVEIWGDIPDAMSHGRYAKTREMKEEFNKGRDTFLGIHYLACQSDDRLESIFEPFIGRIAPFNFTKAQDTRIESAHWSDADEALEACRKLAASMLDGIFPNEQWLRKRGKYANRPGELYNTLAIYVQKHLGGTRNVRALLGQAEASTKKWTPESVAAAWRKFEAEHDLTPAQCKGAYRRSAANRETMLEGARIYETARRLGVVDQVRGNQVGRKRKWTVERIEEEWRAFCAEIGRTPTQCMGTFQRERLPRSVTDRATRVYQAASRMKLLGKLNQSARR